MGTGGELNIAMRVHILIYAQISILYHTSQYAMAPLVTTLANVGLEESHQLIDRIKNWQVILSRTRKNSKDLQECRWTSVN